MHNEPVEGDNPLKVSLASLIGTCLEYYDHFIFATASTLVFPFIIFSHHRPEIALLVSLLSYGLAFVFRPVGAILFGHFGDKFGRKKVLVVTLMLMGIATFLIGTLPTFETIGMLSPILLVFLRACQGLALGGEWGGAALMVNEAKGGAKSFLGSIVQIASPLGFLLANVVFAIVDAATSDQEFLDWGWRIPFLSSAVLVLFGLYLRVSLQESPEFSKTQISKVSFDQLPFKETLSKHFGSVSIAVGVRAGSDVAWYIFSLFLQIYLLRIGVDKSIALQAGIFAAITQMFAIPFFGYLGDRFGNRTILEIGSAAGILWAFAFFPLVNSKDPLWIILACVVGMFIQAALWAPLASFIPKLFPTSVRYTGAGFGFQLAGIFGASFAPLIALTLLDKYNSTLPVSIYVTTSLAFVVVAAAFVPRRP